MFVLLTKTTPRFFRLHSREIIPFFCWHTISQFLKFSLTRCQVSYTFRCLGLAPVDRVLLEWYLPLCAVWVNVEWHLLMSGLTQGGICCCLGPQNRHGGTSSNTSVQSKGGRSSDSPILRSRSRSSDFRLRSFPAFSEATQSLHRTSWGPKKRHNRFIAWNLFEGNELCRYIAAFGAPMKRHNRFIAWNLFKGNELCRYIAVFGAQKKW